MSDRPPYVWKYDNEEIIPCNQCGKDIWFATTKKGKPCPVTKSTGHMHFTECEDVYGILTTKQAAKPTATQTDTIVLHETDDRNNWTLKVGRDLLKTLDGCTFTVTFQSISLPEPDGRGPGTITLEIES